VSEDTIKAAVETDKGDLFKPNGDGSIMKHRTNKHGCYHLKTLLEKEV
jgi:hypothetical protein